VYPCGTAVDARLDGVTPSKRVSPLSLMKISILTPDLSHNCLGRAYLLAKILKRRYEVEVAGPMFGKGIWQPVANDTSINYKPLFLGKTFKIRKVLKAIDGKVIYASKPLLTSFGLALLKKITEKKPLILDIDDWQLGLAKENSRSFSLSTRLAFLAYSLLRFDKPTSYWNILFFEQLTQLADKITVSNTFLQRKFKGIIIPHARDTNYFSPQKIDTVLARRHYGIDKTKQVIMFCGHPRPYKGIEDLIEAMSLIDNKNTILVIAGISSENSYGQKILKLAKQRLRNRFIALGIQKFCKLPQILAMADIVVVPQRKNTATTGQTPAKLFDAMAMEKPIVSTKVSNIPKIIKDAGWLIPPENPRQLADTIQYVLGHPAEAKKRAQKARQVCVEKYSWHAVETTLVQIFKEYE